MLSSPPPAPSSSATILNLDGAPISLDVVPGCSEGMSCRILFVILSLLSSLLFDVMTNVESVDDHTHCSRCCPLG